MSKVDDYPVMTGILMIWYVYGFAFLADHINNLKEKIEELKDCIRYGKPLPAEPMKTRRQREREGRE